jgi:hypothetical protein
MIVSHILQAGTSSLLAQAIGGTGAAGLLATGSTQATALQLPASHGIMTTAAAGGVKLPPIEMGSEVWLRNDSGANVTVYPFETTGVTIAPAASSQVVATGKTIVFKAATGTVWLPLLTA